MQFNLVNDTGVNINNKYCPYNFESTVPKNFALYFH